MSTLAFTKMHGLGNDFVVVGARGRDLGLAAQTIRHLADRRKGVGCDQVVVIGRSSRADASVRFYNPDASEAGACGNGTRCVAWLLGRKRGWKPLTLETTAGLLPATARADGWSEVGMTTPRLDWRDIPLREARDTLHLEISHGPLTDAVGVGMGNPHAVFFVPRADGIDIETLGPQLEHDWLFPERANIGIAEIVNREVIRLRVWERGTGLTPACGSGACAALVAAVRRGLTERRARVLLDGGELEIAWPADAPVRMAGPTTLSFEGRIELRDTGAHDA